MSLALAVAVRLLVTDPDATRTNWIFSRSLRRPTHVWSFRPATLAATPSWPWRRGGCDVEPEVIERDNLDNAFLEPGKADAGVQEGTADDIGALRVANESTRSTIDKKVKLDKRASDGVLAFRGGCRQESRHRTHRTWPLACYAGRAGRRAAEASQRVNVIVPIVMVHALHARSVASGVADLVRAPVARRWLVPPDRAVGAQSAAFAHHPGDRLGSHGARAPRASSGDSWLRRSARQRD